MITPEQIFTKVSATLKQGRNLTAGLPQKGGLGMGSAAKVHTPLAVAAKSVASANKVETPAATPTAAPKTPMTKLMSARDEMDLLVKLALGLRAGPIQPFKPVQGTATPKMTPAAAAGPAAKLKLAPQGTGAGNMAAAPKTVATPPAAKQLKMPNLRQTAGQQIAAKQQAVAPPPAAAAAAAAPAAKSTGTAATNSGSGGGGLGDTLITMQKMQNKNQKWQMAGNMFRDAIRGTSQMVQGQQPQSQFL